MSTKIFVVIILPIHQEEFEGQVHFGQLVQLPLKMHSSYWKEETTIANNQLRKLGAVLVSDRVSLDI